MSIAETITDWAIAIDETALSMFIAESSWAFPMLEVLHIIGLCTVVGTIAMVDFRLMGVAASHRSVTSLSDDTLPFTHAGFALALVTGVLMFTSNAELYSENLPFRIKLLLLAFAGLNILIFHKVIQRNVARWDADPAPPSSAKIAGALSLICWIAIVIFGRWIAFVD